MDSAVLDVYTVLRSMYNNEYQNFQSSIKIKEGLKYASARTTLHITHTEHLQVCPDVMWQNVHWLLNNRLDIKP
jgi:hypothetical protein